MLPVLISIRQEVRKVKTITTADIHQVLQALCPSTEVLAIHPGPRSYSNQLWRAETDEGELLVRVPGRTSDPEVLRATLVASRLANEAGVPAPRFRAFAPTTSLGRPVVVQEYAPGTRLADGPLDPTKQETLGRTLGEWVGRLHTIRRAKFGSVLNPSDDRPWGDVVLSRVDAMLSTLPRESLPSDSDQIRSAFARLAELAPGDGAALTHGDLYLDNILLRDGRPSCLLDFEHASFTDRFADFGKLRELVFERHPEIERPFFDAYSAIHPKHESDEVRMRLGLGLYALSQLHYFHTWQPDLVGFYNNRLGEWLRLSSNVRNSPA
ncbi:aminoglycoside phosphotransferase family protein [Archangium violaceum]|uniref:phosphotransferase family protein n=1 Tax=Archangium violaceum TaxID=83451 RepID=UPI00193B40D3|nr:aminoglycoside phosphotransferase family protein [Archangium violaceum]QRK07646.1 aminoglycoside phosphotransferase family protein [Archangium violaceum]